MFVQPIGINTNNNRFQRKKINFTGYPETLVAAARKEFTTKTEVADVFTSLITDIAKTPEMAKTYSFDHIQTLLSQKGFMGLLEELRNPKAGEKVQKMMQKAKDDDTLLASFAGNHLQLFNLGKHGFWNRLFNKKNAPQNFVLDFNHGLDSIAIWLDKKGGLRVRQNINDKDVAETIFHIHTDNIRMRKDLQSPIKEAQIYDQNGKLDERATEIHNMKMEVFLSDPYSKLHDPLDIRLF